MRSGRGLHESLNLGPAARPRYVSHVSETVETMASCLLSGAYFGPGNSQCHDLAALISTNRMESRVVARP